MAVRHYENTLFLIGTSPNSASIAVFSAWNDPKHLFHAEDAETFAEFGEAISNSN